MSFWTLKSTPAATKPLEDQNKSIAIALQFREYWVPAVENEIRTALRNEADKIIKEITADSKLLGEAAIEFEAKLKTKAQPIIMDVFARMVSKFEFTYKDNTFAFQLVVDEGGL